MSIRRSKYDIVVEILCLLLLAGTAVYLLVVWRRLPAQVPGHYNAAGEIDRMGSKAELIVLPVISWVLYAGMTVLGRFPQIWNTGVTITEQNRDRVYRVLKNMIGTTKLFFVLAFSYLTIHTARLLPLPAWYLPVFLIAMFGMLAFFIVKLVKSR